VGPVASFVRSDVVTSPAARKTLRAYVELTDKDADGGEMIVAAIFSYRHSGIRSKRALEQDLAKARHRMRRTSVGSGQVKKCKSGD
jgi:hypothetical protein